MRAAITDGTYQISSPATGQFYILAGGTSFRQLTTGSFYGGEFDAVEQNVVLEPEWVRQSIVVTATGTPQPQAQVSASVSVLTKTDFLNRADMVDPLRQVPGFDVVQTGQRGGVTSVFIRGGNSDANKVLFDGVPMEDIGGRFDLSTVSSTGISTRGGVSRAEQRALGFRCRSRRHGLLHAARQHAVSLPAI